LFQSTDWRIVQICSYITLPAKKGKNLETLSIAKQRMPTMSELGSALLNDSQPGFEAVANWPLSVDLDYKFHRPLNIGSWNDVQCIVFLEAENFLQIWALFFQKPDHLRYSCGPAPSLSFRKRLQIFKKDILCMKQSLFMIYG